MLLLKNTKEEVSYQEPYKSEKYINLTFQCHIYKLWRTARKNLSNVGLEDSLVMMMISYLLWVDKLQLLHK